MNLGIPEETIRDGIFPVPCLWHQQVVAGVSDARRCPSNRRCRKRLQRLRLPSFPEFLDLRMSTLRWFGLVVSFRAPGL